MAIATEARGEINPFDHAEVEGVRFRFERAGQTIFGYIMSRSHKDEKNETPSSLHIISESTLLDTNRSSIIHVVTAGELESDKASLRPEPLFTPEDSDQEQIAAYALPAPNQEPLFHL